MSAWATGAWAVGAWRGTVWADDSALGGDDSQSRNPMIVSLGRLMNRR